MTGPQGLKPGECWWCSCGKRQTCHHLWRRIEKDCHWEHPGAPSARWLWKEETTEAVLEYLDDTRVGYRVSSGRARVDESRDEEEVPGTEGEEGGPGSP